jgi:hypothetical protein
MVRRIAGRQLPARVWNARDAAFGPGRRVSDGYEDELLESIGWDGGRRPWVRPGLVRSICFSTPNVM